MLKYLSQFQLFEWDRFAEGKIFHVVGQAPWTDFDTGANFGTKVEVGIVADLTAYDRSPGDTRTNQYEKVVFKVGRALDEIPPGTQVRPLNVVAKIYGDYRNELSLKASDVEVIPTHGSTSASAAGDASASVTPSRRSAGEA